MTTSLFGIGASVAVNVAGTLIPQSFIGTAGQTVFPITNFSYTPGTNSLLVFINGQKQTSGKDYTETSANSFTLLEGVIAGDGVDVIGFPVLNLSAGAASSIAFTQSATGATIRNVQVKLQESVSVLDFGAIGDGVADDTASITVAIAWMTSGTELVFPDGYTFKVSTLVFLNKTNFSIRIDGRLVSNATKPGPANTDMRSTQGGVAPVLGFFGCTFGKIIGKGNIQNGFREALYFSTSNDIDVQIDCRGNGTNDNLVGVYVRFCARINFGVMTLDGITLRPTNNVTENFNNWSNNVQLWDSTELTFAPGFTSRNAGMNGIYLASNCADVLIKGAVLELNAGSGIQVAWSSFGTFPIRWNISDCIIRNNQADGIDINNTQGTNQDCYSIVSGNLLSYNGWINGNPANAAGSDGSGIATIIGVNKVDFIGNHAYEPASYGIFISSSKEIYVSGGTIVKTNAGSLNAGVFVGACTSVEISNVRCRVTNTLAAISTQSTTDLTIRGGAYDGLVTMAAGVYQNCQIIDSRLTCYNQFTATMDVIHCNVIVSNATQNGILLSNPGVKCERNTVTATNHGIVCTAQNNCVITENTINVTGAEGILVTNCTNVAVERNNSTTSANAAGIHLAGVCTSCSLILNQGISTGGGNSLLVDAGCLLTQKAGNTGTGATSFGGTYGMNF